MIGNSTNYNQENTRNCGCGCGCGFGGNTFQMPATISNFVSGFDDVENCCCCDCKNQTREEMIEKIKCYQFAIIELGLYLDTHPDDQKAICLHREYSKVYKELTDSYQKVYGPLTIFYPCNKWRWLEEPWPWERGNF